LPGDSSLYRMPETDLWRVVTPNRRVVALFREDKLMARLESVLGRPIKLVPPGADHPDVLVAMSAGRMMPAWQMAIADQPASQSPLHLYFWTGMLVLAGMAVL